MNSARMARSRLLQMPSDGDFCRRLLLGQVSANCQLGQEAEGLFCAWDIMLSSANVPYRRLRRRGSVGFLADFGFETIRTRAHIRTETNDSHRNLRTLSQTPLWP